jgi:translation initiation factor 2 subunit 3
MPTYDKFIKESMINQPVINVGMIGSVSNGKSSLTKAISGQATQRHSKEQEKNITIRLGYSNAKIYKCKTCPRPDCYQSTSSAIYEHICVHCNNSTDLITHVSFVDAPGHAELVSTMLNGTAVMDHCILVESVTNDQIPALQTIEHFEIAQNTGLQTAIICLNKLDLMLKNKSIVTDAIDRIDKFVKTYENTKIPIVPVSGTMEYNIDIVCEYIANMAVPKKDISPKYKMLVIRSFNINKERTPINNLKGGVVGGSLVKGMINVNDDVIIYPGCISKSNGNWTYTPLYSKILSISSDKNELNYAIPGGLIGVQLDIDSAFTGDDRLVGQVLYNRHEQPNVYSEITLKYKKLTRKLTEYIMGNVKRFVVEEVIQINVNSNNILSKIKSFDNQTIVLLLEKPICLELGDLVSISRINDKSIDICGYGVFEAGVECERTH